MEVTIRDIAQLTGYSVSTVSRALNNRPRISEATRKKILKIADELEYIPNSKAVSLSIGKSYSLGVIVPYSSYNSYYDKIINAIISESFKKGYRVSFLPTNYDKAVELSYFKLLSSKEYDGLIVTSLANTYCQVEKYLAYGNIVSCEDTGNTKIPCVVLERAHAYEKILNKLKRKGLTRIGITFSREPTSSIGSTKVYATFAKALPYFSTAWTVSNCRTYEDGVKAAEYFYRSSGSIECIFANSDEIAAGMYEYFQNYATYVPLIIGQDNLAISRALGLSSIDFHLHTLGSEAVKLCLSGEHKKIGIKSAFIERNLC